MSQLSKTALERAFQRKGKGESKSSGSITYDKQPILIYHLARKQWGENTKADPVIIHSFIYLFLAETHYYQSRLYTSFNKNLFKAESEIILHFVTAAVLQQKF